jgi:rhodanese-related sulfurtransferase
MGNRQAKDALYDALASVGKALGNGRRAELVDVLAQGERSVEVLAQATGLKLTTASAHLQALRHGGLVQIRKDGTRVYYRLASEAVAQLFIDVRDVASRHLAETKQAAAAFLGDDPLEPMTRDELLSRVAKGRTVVLDVRPAAEFETGHIEGAVSIPLDQLRERLKELPARANIVAYCRGEYCVLAYDAVRLLRAQGRKAQRMEGGMLEWRLEERPVAVSESV